MFVNNHTYYSLRYGTLSPQRLATLSVAMGASTLVHTDINSTAASLDMVRLAKAQQLKPILGIDFRNGATQAFILLAKNNKGFENSNQYLTSFLHQKVYTIPSKCVPIPDTFVIYPFQKAGVFQLKKHEFIGIKKEELSQLKFSPWRHQLSKLIVLQTITFENKKGFNSHRLLRAIDNNSLLSKLPTSEQGSVNDTVISVEDLRLAFSEFPQIITNTERLLSQCSIHFDLSTENSNNQKFYSSNETLDYKFLVKLAYDGLSYRYKKPTKAVYDRIKKELGVIKEKNFVSYFLINWKILKYARSKNYFYVGRGSGANSIIAYLLRITDVDPVELDLYFERFINLYRKSPPDFDLDFSWRDRDDITRYIFEHFKHTTLIAVYNTFKYKASVRELGKVFGLPKTTIDTLTTGHFKENDLDQLSKLVLNYSKYIQGFPNYLGIHAGGILISETPIYQYTATFMPPKGYATTQFDMVVAENAGLHKFDILSQRGLGKIKEAVDIVAYNQPNIPPIDIHDIKRFKQDERIKIILKKAAVIGCFYVESPAMRMLLKKLQVDDYLGLVAASSVIRPGVAKSGMMREYILRYRFPERRKEAHPVMLDIMPETFGVMVYQEDVIKVAHHFGGLSLGESDVLRRGMSGKQRSKTEFNKVKEQFFTNCKSSGKPEKLVREIWMQIESFAGYAFAKGHSASYAVESYQSLFLKAYFPLEYMVATLNNFGGFYGTELYVHEARMHGGIIQPPCINKSYTQTVIYGKTIYLGFQLLDSLPSKTYKRIVEERSANGLFKHLNDFIDRVPISMEQMAILIKIDAFRFTKNNKRELLWEAHMKISKTIVNEPSITLFKPEHITYTMPELVSTAQEDAFDQIQLLGFPICSFFELLDTKIALPLRAKHLMALKGKLIQMAVYLVTVKKTITSNGKYMYFGTFLDADGDFVDTVHFPPVALKYPFRGKAVYKITGKVTEEFDCINIEVTAMERLAIIEDPRYTDSRKAQRPRPNLTQIK
ncbi:MAG: DNA polymerase III subunit alpha [Flavobacteriaceae bacterium]|nr:DNA polymerase III subunit alpha [Flavobacteriaceae bacterium]